MRYNVADDMIFDYSRKLLIRAVKLNFARRPHCLKLIPVEGERHDERQWQVEFFVIIQSISTQTIDIRSLL